MKRTRLPSIRVGPAVLRSERGAHVGNGEGASEPEEVEAVADGVVDLVKKFDHGAIVPPWSDG